MSAATTDRVREWALKSVILLSGLVVSLSFSVVSPILPKMSAALATDADGAYLVKMVLGVVGAAMVVGAPAAGLLSDRFGRRIVLVAAALIYTAAGVAPFLLDDLSLILVARFVLGLAAVTIATVGAAMVGDRFDAEQGRRLMGGLVAAAMAGSLVVTPIAGLLGDTSWRLPFLIYLVGLPIAGLAWMGAPSKAGRGPSPQSAASVASERMRFPYALAFLALLIGTITYIPVIYVPFHLREIGIEKPSAIGLLLTFDVLVGAVTASQFGRARHHLSSRAAFCFSFAGMAAGIGTVALATGYPQVIVGMFVLGLGLGWLAPNMMSSAVASAGEGSRGRVLGVVKSAHAVAPAVGVTALEPIVRWSGVQGILLLTSTLAAVMCAGMAIAAIRGRRLAAAG